jgi:hypothetical protein
VDSSTEDRPRQSREERSQEAESLLGHAIFKDAVLQLRRSIFERLIALPAGDPKVVELHTRAKVLDEIVGELRTIANEIKFRRSKDDA